jgi:hypothetical protein
MRAGLASLVLRLLLKGKHPVVEFVAFGGITIGPETGCGIVSPSPGGCYGEGNGGQTCRENNCETDELLENK